MSEFQENPLIRAAREGDLCSLFEQLLEGVDVNACDERNWTALTHASHCGHYEIARQLLDSGADPNKFKSYDMTETPLSTAAVAGHFDLIRLLIAHGADANCYAGPAAVRASTWARWNDHHPISEFLLYHEDKLPRGL